MEISDNRGILFLEKKWWLCSKSIFYENWSTIFIYKCNCVLHLIFSQVFIIPENYRVVVIMGTKVLIRRLSVILKLPRIHEISLSSSIFSFCPFPFPSQTNLGWLIKLIYFLLHVVLWSIEVFFFRFRGFVLILNRVSDVPKMFLIFIVCSEYFNISRNELKNLFKKLIPFCLHV